MFLRRQSSFQAKWIYVEFHNPSALANLQNKSKAPLENRYCHVDGTGKKRQQIK
jgi:hypothetical protein